MVAEGPFKPNLCEVLTGWSGGIDKAVVREEGSVRCSEGCED